MPRLLADAIAVALGGALGSVARWSIGLLLAPRYELPLATLAVNVSGCLAIGFFAQWLDAFPASTAASARALLMAGVCGGYTTFSAFGLETVRLVQRGATGRAATYVALSIALSLAATATGLMLGARARDGA